MSLAIPTNYVGPPLPGPILSLLPILARHSFSLVATGSGKTLRVFRGGENRGYINSTVVQRGGVIGYHFAKHGTAADHSPKAIAATLPTYFAEKYGCSAAALDIYEGSGSNAGRTFLIFRDAQTAIKVLLADSGVTLDEAVQITAVQKLFVEGRVVDVMMQRRERNAEARNACLAAFGFNCFVCGMNLKRRYLGLEVEVIHVHHEEPLSQAAGEREFDPIASMKPVCPNCHAVIHARTPPYTVEEVQAMLENDKGVNS